MTSVAAVESKLNRTSGIASFEEAFDALLHERPGIVASESGGELSWMKNARERDALRWKGNGLPTTRMERWKYTKVTPLTKARIVLPQMTYEEVKALPEGKFQTLSGEFSAKVTFVDGHFAPQLSQLDVEAGVSVMTLSELYEECVEEGWSAERKAKFQSFRLHVETSDADRETVFAAMNTSFMQDGVLVSVDKGAVLRKPILITYLQSAGGTEAELPMVSPRVFVHLGRRAEAALVEHYAAAETDTEAATDAKEYFVNGVSDIRLEEEARLGYAKFQADSTRAWHIGTTRIHQKAGSWSENFQFTLGGKVAREDLHISLEGQGAEAVLDGLYLVGQDQHADHFTAVEHAVPHTTSAQLYKGILGGNGRGVFNGRVHIHKDAQKSNAAQLNQNLLLSKKAEADTKPELEIYADDVKASHGASIGQIDPEHVFYLRARAISETDAVRMLARGFAHDVVFRIQNEAIRSMAAGLVDEKFDQLVVEVRV